MKILQGNDTIRLVTSGLEQNLKNTELEIERLKYQNNITKTALVAAKEKEQKLATEVLEMEQKLKQQQQRIDRKAQRRLDKANKERNFKIGFEEVNWNPSRLPKKAEKDTVTVPEQVTVTDTILLAVNTPISAEAPEQVKSYDDEIRKVAAEIEAMKNIEIAQMETVIVDLSNKVALLENQLSTISAENSSYQAVLKAKIAALNEKIRTLEAEQVVKTDTVVIEKNITQTQQLSLNDIIKPYEVTVVYFDKGRTNIQDEFTISLEKVGLLMLRYPEINAVVTGFTDKSGNPDLNFKLSRERAQSVKQFLLRQGISSQRIDVSYYGDAKASASNDPFSRRVEVRLLIL